MMRLKTLAAAAILVAAASGPAKAQDAPADPGLQEGVAAIVNDEVISTFDVRQRALFILATSNIPITQENFSRVAEQALRSLIEERLQIQEAREFRITIGDDDVDRTVEGLARQNGATRAQLEAELAAFASRKTGCAIRSHGSPPAPRGRAS
jgi:peptidyl-prolyl cis-trans isomerase SurA